MSAVTWFINEKKEKGISFTCINLENRSNKVDATHWSLETQVGKKTFRLCLHTQQKAPILLVDLILYNVSELM